MSMPVRLFSLLLLLCLLQGCASAPAVPKWNMQAVQRISHSAGQNAVTYFELGKFYQARGQLVLAAEAFAASIALDPQQLAARNALAVLDARQGRLEQAATALLVLVRDFPEAAQQVLLFVVETHIESGINHLG